MSQLSKTNNVSFVKFVSFCHPKWCDLPAMFNHIKMKTRGESHKILTTTVRIYDDDWKTTISYNTVKNCDKFYKLLKSMNIESRFPCVDRKFRKNKFEPIEEEDFQFDAQMFSGMRDLKTKTTETIDQAREILEKVDSLIDGSSEKVKVIIDNLSSITETISSNINMLNGFMDPAGNSLIQNVIGYIVKIVALGYLLTQSQNRTLKGILALLALTLPAGVGNSIIGSLSRAIKGVCASFYPKDCPDMDQDLPLAPKITRLGPGGIEIVENETYMEANAGNEECAPSNLIVSFFNMTKFVMMGLFKGADAEALKTASLSAQKIKMVADYIRSSTTIVDMLCRILDKVMTLLGDVVVKHFGVIPGFLKEDTLTPLVDRYVEMKELKRDTKAKTNSVAAKQVLQLYKDVLKMQADIVKAMGRGTSFEKTRVMPYLSVMVKNLEQIVQQIPEHLKGTKNARRVKPFWIYICGEPRIGKTSVLQPYLINVLAKECGIIDQYEDYSNYTYFRNCGDEYWEKYAGQPFLWYNDLFQVHTDEQQINQAITELTNVVDDNLYALNMAFDEKHSVYFDSQFVVSNAQTDIHGAPYIANKCLSGGKHLYSRRNICIQLRLTRDYKNHETGINYHVMNERMKTVPNVGTAEDPLFPKDMYCIDFIGINDGQILYSMLFNDAISHIVQLAKKHRETQSVFKDKLYRNFEAMWAQANDEDTSSFLEAREVGPEEMFHDMVNHMYHGCDISMVLCKKCREEFESLASFLPPDEFRRHYTVLVTASCHHFRHDIIPTTSKWEQFKLKGKEIASSVMQLMRDIFKSPLMRYVVLWISIATFINFASIMLSYAFTPKEMEPQSSEVNIKAKAKQIIRVKAKDLVAQAYDQQNSDIETRLKRHIMLFEVGVEHAGENVTLVKPGSILCIGSDVFVMPKHFYARMQDLNDVYSKRGDNMYIDLCWDFNSKVRVPYHNIQFVDLGYAHLTDIVFMRVPNACKMTNISKFVVRKDDKPSLFQCYLYGLRLNGLMTSISVNSVDMRSQNYVVRERSDPIYGETLKGDHIQVPRCYYYDSCNTVNGDCGMLMMNADSRMNARKIMGMHVAGSSKQGSGVSSLLYCEDFEEAISKFYPIQTPIFMEAHAHGFGDLTNCNSKCLDGMSNLFRIDGTYGEVMVNGKMRRVKMTIPSKTKISKSVVYDIMEEDFGPAYGAPAQLSPIAIDGIRVSPFEKGISKLVVMTCDVLTTDKHKIIDHMAYTVQSWESPYVRTPRVLTDEEAINGYGILNPIDLSTSPGFPYTLIKNGLGKRPWFDLVNDKYVMKNELLTFYTEREELAKHGLIKETMFIDTLKDEIRPLEKVVMCKTRVFQVGPMCLSILMRKYFGEFICHCQCTFIEGEMGIGINPNSYQWSLLLQRLITVGNKFINGDYSNYDASVVQAIMMDIVELINRFYNDGEVNATVRRVLFATFLNNCHLVEDFVFCRQQGNMSGIALTTIINCLFNMFLLRYAYIALVENDLAMYHKRVSATFFGDDNLAAIADEIIDKLNMLSYARVMAKLGITYTTADKNVDMPKYVELENISYLKRTFVLEPRYNIYRAPLEWKVIMEIPRWSESDPYNMNDQMNRFNAVLIESVHYGREVYDKLYKRFMEYMILLRRSGFQFEGNTLLSYQYILHGMYPDFYANDRSDLAQTELSGSVLQNDCVSFKSVKLLTLNATNSGQLALIKPTTNYEDEEEFQAQTSERTVKAAVKQIKRVQMGAQMNDEDKENIDRDPVQTFVNSADMFAQSNDLIFDYEPEKDNIIDAKNFKEEFKKLCCCKERVQFYVEDQDLQAQTEDSTLMIRDENAGETVVRSEVSTTFDDTIPHVTNRGEIITPYYTNPYIDITMDAFIKREWYLAQVTWTSTFDRSTMGSLGKLPQLFLPYIKEKLANISYWAPDIELIFKVNGTPMHYGRFMFAVIPQSFFLDDAYKQPLNMSQHRFIQISPTGNQTVRMMVPYMHFLDKVSITENFSVDREVWELYGWPSVPLTSAQSATPSPVTISIYGRIIEPRFAGFTHHPIMNAQMYDMEAQSNEQLALSRTSNTTEPTKSTGIFQLGSKIAKDVTVLASDMSAAASMVGFGVSANLTSTTPFQVRSALLCKAEDLPMANVLGPSLGAATRIDDSDVNGAKDGMMISKMAGRMALLETIRIPNTTAVNDVLFNLHLSLRELYAQDYSITPAANTVFPLPAKYLGKLAKVWRGSMRFHFSFVASAFHSMRIRCVYAPPSIVDVDVNAGSAAYDINEVWDINNQTDYSLTIPYLQRQEWIANSDHGIGRLKLVAMTILSSAMAEPQPIYLQVWASMCDDFQMAYPFVPLYGEEGLAGNVGNPDVVAIPKFVDADEHNTVYRNDHIVVREAPGVMEAQSNDALSRGNPLLNYRADQFPAMSSDALQALDYPVIGGKGDMHKVYKVCTSYEISSVKELVNMLTPVDRIDVKTTAAPTTAPSYQTFGRVIRPYAPFDRSPDDMAWSNFWAQVTCLFRYGKGSTRLHVISSHSTRVMGYLAGLSSNWNTSFWGTDTTDVLFGDASINYITDGGHFFSNVELEPADIIIPYYSAHKCLPVFYGNFKTLSLAPYFTSGSLVCGISIPAETPTGTSVDRQVYFISGGDDYQLGYQMPVPRCRYKKG